MSLYRIGYQDHVLNQKFYRLELSFDKNCEYDTEGYSNLKQVSKILIKKVSVNDNTEDTAFEIPVDSCFLYNYTNNIDGKGYSKSVSQIKDTYLFPAVAEEELKNFEKSAGKKTVLLSKDGISWLLEYEHDEKNTDILKSLKHAKFTYIYKTQKQKTDYKYDKDGKCRYTYCIYPTTYGFKDLDVFNDSLTFINFKEQTIPATKLNNIIYGQFEYRDPANTEVYCLRELKNYNSDWISKKPLSITPMLITNKFIKNKVAFTGDSTFKRGKNYSFENDLYDLIHSKIGNFLFPNVEEIKKPEKSTKSAPIDDGYYPSITSKNNHEITSSDWTADQLKTQAGLFSFRSDKSITIIEIDKTENVTYVYECKNASGKLIRKNKTITIKDSINGNSKTYDLRVDSAGYLIDDNGNRISTEEDNGLGPHHYPSQWTFSSTSNSTTSKTEVSETVEEMIEDAIEKNELRTPSEYYSSDTFFSTIEPGQDGYNKTKIIIDSKEEIKISSLKDIPTWFWLDTLKNWCTFKANNLADVFTGNELYVWNGRNGWLKFSRLIELWRKNRDSIKETVKKLSLYDFDRMNLIFQESISPDNDGYDNERYYIDFKGIKLEKDCAYSNHDKETFETITSKIEFDKEEREGANSYRVTLFSGCPNIIRTGSNEICLCYSLEPNYSKKIMTHLFGKEIKIKYFSHSSRGSGTIREFQQFQGEKYYNEKICLQLFKEDFINSVCAASFGNGNDKTIEKDFHDFFAKEVDEEPSEFFVSSSEASLVDAPEINNIKIEDAKLKIKFTANDLYSVGSDTTSTDFAERWN